MKFLKSMILYQLSDELRIIKTKFNFLIKDIHIGDINLLNTLFAKLNSKLKMSSKDVFMNARNVEFLNRDGEPTVFQQGENWKIGIAIQGFKTSSTGLVTPIWKIVSAQIADS